MEAVHLHELKVRYSAYFQEGCIHNVVPYPGIMDMLDTLKKSGAILAVLSNKQHENTKIVVRRTLGEAYFSYVQGQCTEFPRKPDPTAALHIAKTLGVKPEECIYIGDTSTDM